MNAETVVFVDTSIQIARVLREQQTRQRIESWLSRYKLKVTGTVALQEFRNRVRDISYLLTKLNQFNSYRKALDYIYNVLPTRLERKRRICIMALHDLLPGVSDEELTERTRLYCRTLLVFGENRFLQQVDSIGPGIGCYWAQVPVREKRPFVAYEFGDKRCSKSEGRCQVGDTLRDRLALCAEILNFLDALPPQRVTPELASARTFLQAVVNGNALVRIGQEEPCLRFGDLLLAMESERVPNFYTMNYRESQAYCDVLGQSLIVRPNNPDHDERLYVQAQKPWPAP